MKHPRMVLESSSSSSASPSSEEQTAMMTTTTPQHQQQQQQAVVVPAQPLVSNEMQQQQQQQPSATSKNSNKNQKKGKSEQQQQQASHENGTTKNDPSGTNDKTMQPQEIIQEELSEEVSEKEEQKFVQSTTKTKTTTTVAIVNTKRLILGMISIGIVAMIFTAWQMSDYPDSFYAALCRWIIRGIGGFLRILASPFRICLGLSSSARYAGHMPVSTMDYGYKDPSLQTTTS